MLRITFLYFYTFFDFWHQPVWQLLWNLPECQQLLHNLFSFQASKSANKVHCAHSIKAICNTGNISFTLSCNTLAMKAERDCCMYYCLWCKLQQQVTWKRARSTLNWFATWVYSNVLDSDFQLWTCALQYCSITSEQTSNFLSLPTQTGNWMFSKKQTQIKDLPAKQFIFKWPWVSIPFSLTRTTLNGRPDTMMHIRINLIVFMSCRISTSLFHYKSSYNPSNISLACNIFPNIFPSWNWGISENIPQFSKLHVLWKDLKDNKDNSLHLGQKYARIYLSLDIIRSS